MKKRVLAVLMSMAMLSGLGTMAVQAEEAPEKRRRTLRLRWYSMQ